MYPPPYHNMVMKSGEWKLWLERVLGDIPGGRVSVTNRSSSGTTTLGSGETTLASITVDWPEDSCVIGISQGTLYGSLRVKHNGESVVDIPYPSVARQLVSVTDLAVGDVIDICVFDGIAGLSVDWWYDLDAMYSLGMADIGLKYPAPEYENTDPRWVSRWTDIYKMLSSAADYVPGRLKTLTQDTVYNENGYSYTSGATTTVLTVQVPASDDVVRIEAFSRSLFTDHELYVDGAKVAELARYPTSLTGTLTIYTFSSDVYVFNGGGVEHTVELKCTAGSTATGHLEAGLYAIT